MKNVTATFVYEKDTKNTIRFTEQVEGDLDTPKIGTIYVAKATLKEMGWNKNKTLVLTIECK